jgi:DNA-binding transcriptional MerR regulator
MAQGANIHMADRPAVRAGVREEQCRGDDGDAAGAPIDTPMTIGEVAREFGLTLRALRFYETKRLITPQRSGASRLYRRCDCERIALILTGRRLGFTLAEIKHLLNAPDGNNLHLSREKCIEQINLLERQKRDIELALGELRQIYTSFYRSHLKDRIAS